MRAGLLAAAVFLAASGHEPSAEEPKLATPRPLQPVVEIEEEVYRYTPADNGADPMWCYGSTCLVRIGEEVFASGIETLKGVPPLNNVRWKLFRRGRQRWEVQQVDKVHRTREPCPLAGLPGGRVFLSVNPTLTPAGARAGRARPEILEFSAADPKAPFKALLPRWEGQPAFTEHSYRSFAADAPGGEMILFQNVGYTHSEWAFRDRGGKWSACGKLKWLPRADPKKAPYGATGARVNYPNVFLTRRAVHFCGASAFDQWERMPHVGDTRRKWGPRFRRLYYTWTPDVTKRPFRPWLEIASTHKTGGWCFPGDLWVDPQGAAHIAWLEAPIHKGLRDERFPDIKRTCAIQYAIVRAGRAVARRTLAQGGEGISAELPGAPAGLPGQPGGLGQPRFHVTADNRLLAVYYVGGTDPAGRAVSENRLMELPPGAAPSRPIRLPLKHPMIAFFTATPRGGSAPSDTIDLLGYRAGAGAAVCYARIRLR